MESELFEKLSMIHRHFGNENQRRKLVEEAREYIEAENDEEAADVFVVAMQLYMNSVEIRKIVKAKVDRTLDRIVSGYYEVDKKILV